MFSRRHPFLFFILIFTGMALSAAVVLSALFVLSDPASLELGEKVGIVEVIGAIMDAGGVISDLKTFRENPSIKAVVVRIDSPGGAVGPAQEIYREIRKTAGKKKIVASLGSVAASGGYYIAAAADTIMANPGTITGSIGVIMSYTNLEELFGKIGLSPVVIKSGEYKDIASPVRTMTEAERALLQEFAGDLHDQFINDVATGRGMDVAAVRQLADGRVFSGKKAREIGLIDNLGNLEDAIEMAGRMAGIEGDVVSVYPPKEEPFSLLEWISGMSAVEWVGHITTQLGGLSGGYLFQPGR
ncbi:MAG: signal peptide peptidase SppA [Thermodesulfobacteriota bacterium]